MSGEVSIAGVVAAGITLYFTGGNYAAAAFAYTLAAGIESYVLAPDIQGPRLEDRKIQLSTYGAQIPIVFGSVRLAGNVIWPRNFEVEEHSESESTKGGGGDTISYNYTATFAVLLCEGPIEGIGRIWMNKKLVYDPNAAVTTDPAIVGMTVYLGTETQEPDPLMVAADGSAPAYRGWAYIVFEDLELSNSGFGNRPPSVEVEILPAGITSSDVIGSTTSMMTGGNYVAVIGSLGPASYPNMKIVNATTYAVLHQLRVAHYNSNSKTMDYDPLRGVFIVIAPNSMTYVTVNAATGAKTSRLLSVAIGGDTSPAPSSSINSVTYLAASDQIIFGASSAFSIGSTLYVVNASSYAVEKTYTYETTPNQLINPLLSQATGTSVISFASSAAKRLSVSNPPTSPRVNILGASETIPSFYNGIACIDPTTKWIWTVRPRGAYGNTVNVSVVSDVGAAVIATFAQTDASVGGFIPSSICAVTATNEVWVLLPTWFTPSRIALVAIVTAGVANAVTGLATTAPTFTGFLRVGTSIDPDHITYHAATGKVFISYAFTNATPTTMAVIDPATRIEIATLSMAGGSTGVAVPVTLGSIVSALCTRVPFGLDAADIDVTALTDEVDGYMIGQQMTRRSAIEPLMAAYFFDGVESDHVIKYVKRGGASAVTIAQDDRAAHEAGGELPAHLNIMRTSELELPWTIDVTYTDKARDYQPATQYDRRITRNANDPRRIELAIVMTGEKAKQVALVNLYLPWLRTRFAFSTGLAYGKYEPTDIVTLPTDDVTYVARITRRVDQGTGVQQWEAELEDSAIYTQTGTVAAQTFVPQTIRDPGDTDLVMLDMPILRDVDDNAGYYVAMGGTTDGWPGAVLFKSTDSGASYTSMLSIVNEATIGAASGVLGNFTTGNIFDEGNSVTVVLSSGGPLTSATADQVLNGSNTAVIGAHGRWEVINFKTATLTATDTYLLSGLLRGRRGTEWATGTHVAGDTFVIASTSTWQRPNPGSAEIGLARLYKAPPFGTQLSAAAAESFTNSAVGLEPYSPVDIKGTRVAGDLTITWKRRARYGYGALHTIVPLGEASESYSIDIMSGAVVKRTITASTQTASYTAAQQNTDFGFLQASVLVNVYQVSATVGRGYVGVATI